MKKQVSFPFGYKSLHFGSVIYKQSYKIFFKIYKTTRFRVKQLYFQFKVSRISDYFIGDKIRGYIDRGNFFVNLGCYYGPHLLVSLLIQQEGCGWGKGEYPYFSQL